MADDRYPMVRRRSGNNDPGEARRLWAPWRAAYIQSARKPIRRCIFCLDNLPYSSRKRRLVLYVGAEASVMLNRFPYNNGHLLIAPRRHLDALELLSHNELSALGVLLADCVRILKGALKPQGFNLGANLGRVAGAGITNHIHWHIVPRWEGDTNFMPVSAATRVISEHLDASFARLDPLFRKLKSPVS